MKFEISISSTPIIFIALLVLILFVHCKAESDKRDVRSLSDTDSFENLMKSSGSIILTRSYTLDMSRWTPFSPSFTKFDGNGCTIQLDYSRAYNKKFKLFSGISSKEIYDMKIEIIGSSYTSFTSGSLLGSVSSCYIYHLEIIFSRGPKLENWSGTDGIIASEISSSTMLNVGIKGQLLNANLVSSNSESTYMSSNIGIIAGMVKGTCYFAGLYVNSKIEVESRYMYDTFGVFFGKIDTNAKIIISSSVVTIPSFTITSKYKDYRAGLIIGQNDGRVELDKVLISIITSKQEVSLSCSLSFGSVAGYNNGNIYVYNSFIYDIFNNIEIENGGILKTGGIIGSASQSTTTSITNTSVVVRFKLHRIPSSSYGGFIVGYTTTSSIKLKNTIFAIYFDRFDYPFVYYDVGNKDYYTSFSSSNAYYYFVRAGVQHSVEIRYPSLQSLGGEICDFTSKLDDFSCDNAYIKLYYSKMAYLSGTETVFSVIDSNNALKKVDITFSGTTPSYYYNYDQIYVLDHIPSSITSLTSDDYYLVFMPKTASSVAASFDGTNECVSSTDLPLTIRPTYNNKVKITFKCKRTLSFELNVANRYFSKTVVWKTDSGGGNNGGGGGNNGGGGDGGSGYGEYDPREPIEKLITQILIYVNAGVVGLIVLLSICCYFINRN